MKYQIGKKVDFLWDNYDYYCNTDLVYEGTYRLTGVIESYDEKNNLYGIKVGESLYGVKEDDIIDKAAD